MAYKIILPARLIPEGSKITKIKGAVVYTLHKELRLYGLKGHCQIIPIDESAEVLIRPDTGAINLVGKNQELIWLAEHHELLNFLKVTNPGDYNYG